VLQPSHMVLHGAAHLFHDGEISGAIRDLVDLDRLFRGFSSDEFWPDFVTEAGALGLRRPAYYALRYCCRVLETPIPAAAMTAAAGWAPPLPLQMLMDSLVERAVAGADGLASAMAAKALYIRSHWLRMPLPLLVRHLWHKSRRRPAP